MWDRGHRDREVMWVMRMEVQVRIRVANGPRRKRAHRVHIDWWSRNRGIRSIHNGRYCGSRRRGGKWELDNSRHVDRTGNTEALLLVGLQHVGKTESLATYIARIWLLSCMCSAVPLHVRATGETLATDFTDKRLLSC